MSLSAQLGLPVIFFWATLGSTFPPVCGVTLGPFVFSWSIWGWSSEDSALLIGFGCVWVTTCVPSQIWLRNLNKPI